jgi:hypothetical protein
MVPASRKMATTFAPGKKKQSVSPYRTCHRRREELPGRPPAPAAGRRSREGQQARRGVEGSHSRPAQAGQQGEETRAAPGVKQARARGHAGGIEHRAEERQTYLFQVVRKVLGLHPPESTLDLCAAHRHLLLYRQPNPNTYQSEPSVAPICATASICKLARAAISPGDDALPLILIVR